MAGWLMPSLGDFAHQLWVSLRHPAQDEERSGNMAIVQQIEDALRISLNAALVVAPASTWDDACEGFDVKIILHVNGDNTPAVH